MLVVMVLYNNINRYVLCVEWSIINLLYMCSLLLSITTLHKWLAHVMDESSFALETLALLSAKTNYDSLYIAVHPVMYELWSCCEVYTYGCMCLLHKSSLR